MATKYTVKGIQSELQNVTSENDAVTRHTINSNTNRIYAKNNCGVYEHIGEGLSCVISGTSVRVNVGMGCLYGRDFEVLSNTLVEVEQNTTGFVVAVYDGNVVDGTQRFYLTSIKETDTFVQQDLLNDGKMFMMKLCKYVATTQVDDVIDVEIAKLNDESLLSQITTIDDTKANKTDLNKKVDKAITDSLNKHVALGTRANGTTDLNIWTQLDSAETNKYIGLRLTDALGNRHGFYWNETSKRFVAYNGDASAGTNIANTSDLANKTDFAIGNESKSFAAGKNTTGGTDFEMWHDINQKIIGMRRVIGNDKFGIYANYGNGRVYVYEGDVANAHTLSNYDDLANYAKLSGATFTGGIAGTSVNMSGAVVADTAHITGGNVTIDDGRIEVGGTAFGVVHNGTATTVAQNIITSNYSGGNRRAMFRDDTLTSLAMYLTGYESNGTDINRGISMLDDYVRHFTKTGPRALAHLDEIKSTSLQAARLLQAQQEQIELLSYVVAQDNPEVLKSMKSSRKAVNAFVQVLEQELEDVIASDKQHGIDTEERMAILDEQQEEELQKIVEENEIIRNAQESKILELQKQLEEQAETNAKMQEQINSILESEE